MLACEICNEEICDCARRFEGEYWALRRDKAFAGYPLEQVDGVPRPYFPFKNPSSPPARYFGATPLQLKRAEELRQWKKEQCPDTSAKNVA